MVSNRTGDLEAKVGPGRWIASQIRQAPFVEFPGPDHFPWVGDADAVLDEIDEFLTGERRVSEPDRVLATVMLTDLVSSTEHAASMSNRARLDLLRQHHALVRKELARFRGQEIKTAGHGFLATFDNRRGRYVVDVRFATACAVLAWKSASGSTQAKSS